MKPKELYRAICAQEPTLPVFLQSWWLDVVTPAWNAALTIKGDQVTGVWPYTLQQRFTVTMMRNPQQTPYLGPHVFFPPDIKPSNRDSFEHEVVAGLLEQLPDADVWVQALLPGNKQAGLFRSQQLRVAVQQTFLLDLQQPEATIFRNFKENLRRNIRQASEEISVYEAPELLPLLHEFQSRTLQRKRVASHNELPVMQALLDACLEKGQGTLYAARRGDVTEAIVWNVWDGACSYYFAGAKNPATDNYRAMSLLLWHCIGEARKRGNHTFDFEGSMDPGVERFFRNFGARRELYLILRKNGHWLWKMSRWFKREE